MINQIQTLIKEGFDFLKGLPDGIPLLLALVIGIAMVGWGYTLFRVWLLGVGIWAGYQGALWLVDRVQVAGDMRFIVTVLVTIASALFLWLALRASIFVAGFLIGAMVIRTLGISLFGIDNRWLLLIGGLLAAVLAAAFIKLFIILATAISGAYLTVDAIHGFIRAQAAGNWLRLSTPAREFVPIVLLLLWIAIALFGFAYQYRLTGRGRQVRLHGTSDFR